MHVLRNEPSSVRVEANGDIRIPAALVMAILRRANSRGTADDLREDQADFGPGKIVVIDYTESDSGTELTITRDRRPEVRTGTPGAGR